MAFGDAAPIGAHLCTQLSFGCFAHLVFDLELEGVPVGWAKATLPAKTTPLQGGAQPPRGLRDRLLSNRATPEEAEEQPTKRMAVRYERRLWFAS